MPVEFLFQLAQKIGVDLEGFLDYRANKKTIATTVNVLTATIILLGIAAPWLCAFLVAILCLGFLAVVFYGQQKTQDYQKKVQQSQRPSIQVVRIVAELSDAERSAMVAKAKEKAARDKNPFNKIRLLPGRKWSSIAGPAIVVIAVLAGLLIDWDSTKNVDSEANTSTVVEAAAPIQQISDQEIEKHLSFQYTDQDHPAIVWNASFSDSQKSWMEQNAEILLFAEQDWSFCNDLVLSGSGSDNYLLARILEFWAVTENLTIVRSPSNTSGTLDCSQNDLVIRTSRGIATYFVWQAPDQELVTAPNQVLLTMFTAE